MEFDAEIEREGGGCGIKKKGKEFSIFKLTLQRRKKSWQWRDAYDI